ncbi:carbohydrate kinase family protein [Candidatus Parcubacteria bacterium]|nr:carbohydrate kinase family protein [Candidatus Parcubacteria bacterium]
MFDIITIGAVIRDVTFLTDEGKVIETPENLTAQSLLAFEYGSKIKSEEVFFNFGGGACNAAATFAKLGIRVAVNCRVGEDEEGESAVKNLNKLGINTDLMQTDRERKTGFALVVVDKNQGDRIIFVQKGASNFLEVKKDAISQTKWIYLTSLAGEFEKSLEEINSAIEENKIKLAWNPGVKQIEAGKEKLAKTLKNTEILLVNKDEAIELVQSDEKLQLDFNQINDSGVLAKTIKCWGPKIVVVTDGRNGAYVCAENDDILYAPIISGKRVDTTGAGDSFGSALVSGYILSDDIEKALRFGILNSGNVVGEYGAQNGILSKDEIEKRLDEVKVSYL